ncbi:tetratricopeptide repeat protein [Pseudomonas sp. NA-150]|uniref:tetratricopeptide repeat protein n=1 Tax=Pseudomonas sp. NA-150 TaxID=3367525 RepID=UPI0037C73866
MMRFYVVMIAALLFAGKNAHGDEKVLEGRGNSVLRLGAWDGKAAGWSKVSYSNGQHEFDVYGVVAADANSEALSPDKSKVFVQRVEFGEVTDQDGVTLNTENQYCDLLSMDTGCVMLSRPAEFCSGSWSGSVWRTEEGDSIKLGLETESPRELLKTIAKLKTNENRMRFIERAMYMGVESYLACYPPSDDPSGVNDIGFYLAEGGGDKNALLLFRSVESVAPDRIVLKVNIADSLWSVGRKAEAYRYYTMYREAMKNAGKSNAIPARVLGRLEEKQE